MQKEKIDFVISWVDGNDEEWLNKKNNYLPQNKKKYDVRKQRFRDWDNLKYLFRGIEKNADWVNHIYLVTPGHFPEWINRDNSKITLINQDILFEERYLPTFNNCAVELMMHKIPGISDKFVYFNDDMFILKTVSEEDFFENGLPLDNVGFAPIQASYTKDGKGTYGISVMNTRVVAKRFTKKEIMKRSARKFLDLRNRKDLIKTICMLPFPDLTGFNETHTVNSFLKSTFEDVWENAYDDLIDTVQSKFRGEFNVSQWCMRYWQIATNKFAIRNPGFSLFFDIINCGDEKKVINAILKKSAKVICINDNIKDDKEFDLIKKKVNKAFEYLYPEKSEYEL
jgi:hypothetical protein